jgi:general secretion pathway protein M
MTARTIVERGLNYSPLVAGVIYATVLCLLLVSAIYSVADIWAGASALSDTEELLALLQGRNAIVQSDGGAMNGSPFLEGSSVTIAGAALLQRVAAAVAKANGTIQSSQVDVAGSGAGAVKLQISCEIGQDDLQRLLYDLEAGMPFLFVDELTAEMPQAVGAAGGTGRMHVQLAVSGQWKGAAR